MDTQLIGRAALYPPPLPQVVKHEVAPHSADLEHVKLLAERMKCSAGDIPGDFCFATISDSGRIAHYWVPNVPSAVDEMVAKIERITVDHENVYFAGALFEPGSHSRTERNVRGVLCAVADFDAKHQPATRHSRLPLIPTSEIETSKGNFQCHYWFDRPHPKEDVKPVLKSLVDASGADRTISADHLYRVPGTWNWPNEKKRQEGRTGPEQSKWAKESKPGSECITLEVLAASIPASNRKVAAADPEEHAFDWNLRTQDQQSIDEGELTKELSKNGDRSEIAYAVISRLFDEGYSPQEIVALLWGRHSLPVMQHYQNDESRLKRDVQRIVEKNSDKPLIYVSPAKLIANVDACEIALIKSEADVYQFGSRIVELGEITVDVRDGKRETDLLLKEPGEPRLVELFMGAAHFKQRNGKRWVSTDCPKKITETYLARPSWGLQALKGVINAPTLRPDGSLLDVKGYDQRTGLYFDPRGMEFPAIPESPTWDEAHAALRKLDEIIGEFPFASPVDKAVALSAFLTAPIRRLLPSAPMFAIDGTGAGSGKGKLADSISIVGSGRRATTLNHGGAEEEFEKRLSSVLMRGDLVINIDNMSRPLSSDHLCTILTQSPVDLRVLGQSQTKKVPTNSVILITGNALCVTGDLYRRTLSCLIDPRVEHPGERTFDFDPVQRAFENRGSYVAACLTVLRAYGMSKASQKGKSFGSFEVWCRVVRDALLWLGCADPVIAVKQQADDPEREQFRSFVLSWKSVIGTEALTLKDAVERAQKHSDKCLHDVFTAIGGVLTDTRKLGNYIRPQKLRVIENYRFVSVGLSRSGSAIWKLETVH